MSFTLEELEQITLVLENENKFYREYGGSGRTYRNDTYGKRRAVIGTWLVAVHTPWATPRTMWPKWVGRHTVEDRDQLRRYFDDRYCIPQTETNKYAGIPSLLIEDPPEPTEEPPMTWKEELIAARANGETLQMYLGGEWTNEFGIGYEKGFDFTASRDRYRIKPKEPKAAPLTWQGALKAARERGAVLQKYRKSSCCWDDEGTNGLTAEFRFGAPQDQYRIKPGTDPLEPTSNITVLPADTATQFYAACPCSPTPVKEDTVNKPITITTTTFVNGTDISKMADGEVFNLIASEEAVIESLKKIKAQPKKLVAEIAKREAGIAALVAYLDSKEG